MSVENMIMMNIIGNISDVDNVIKNILSTNKVDLVSALSQIEDNSFLFNVNDDSLEKLIDLNSITYFNKDSSYEVLLKNGEVIKNILGLESNYIDTDIVENISRKKISEELNKIYIEVVTPNEDIIKAKAELERIEKYYKNFQYTSDLSIPIEVLRNLRYFNYKFGVLSKENRLKLRKNYENIPSMILHTGTSNDGEAYLILYPTSLSEEIRRILHSLNFMELLIPEDYNGSFWEIRKKIEVVMLELEIKIKEYETILYNLKAKYKERILFLLDQITQRVQLDTIKEKLARSNRFFYLSGWVSLNDQTKMEEMVNNYHDMLIFFKSDVNLIPPKRIKRNWIFKSFESLGKGR